MLIYRSKLLFIALFLLQGLSGLGQADKITFFLLRGIGREAGHWGETFPGFVRKDYPNAEFIMMDLPGAGKYHDKAALSTVEKMADFLREEHLDMIKYHKGKRVIVATSLAGNVALEWVHQYPSDFHGAILLSTSLKGICKDKERVRPEAKKQFVNIFLTNDVAEREREFLSINSNLNVGNDSLLTAWQEVQRNRPVSKMALLKQTVAGMVYKPAKTPPLVPVLLVGSKADKIVEEACFESVAKAIDADLVLHETAGHGIPIDAPEWLAQVSNTWIEEKAIPIGLTNDVDSMQVQTRTSHNGLFPMRKVDRRLDNSLRSSEELLALTGKAVTDSWKWVDDGFDWIGRFTKEVKVRDPKQRKQLQQISKQLKEEQKQLKKEDASSL